MATYIKTLKEDNGDITYPQTKAGAVYTNEGSDVQTVLDDCTRFEEVAATSALTPMVTSSMIDWSTITGSEMGWKYLGQAKLTSTASSLTFVFPSLYNNYKICIAAELSSSSGSESWNDVRFLNGSSTISNTHAVFNFDSAATSQGANTNVIYALNGNGNAYDTINAEVTSFKTASTQYRKYQGVFAVAGSVYRHRSFNGRFLNATEPDRVQLISGGSYAAGAVIKVWGSNN